MKPPADESPDRLDPDRGMPAALRLLLLPLGDDQEAREEMTRCYYGVMEGAPNSVSVQHAVVLSGILNACKNLPAKGAPAGAPTAIARGEVLKAVAALKADVEALRAELAQKPAATILGDKEMNRLAEQLETRLEPRLRAYMNDTVTRCRVLPSRFFWWVTAACFFLVFILGITVEAWWSARSQPAPVEPQPAANTTMRQASTPYAVTPLNPSVFGTAQRHR